LPLLVVLEFASYVFSNGGFSSSLGMGSATPSRLQGTSLDDADRFKLVEGKVTQLEEFDNGRWRSERIV
jgi:hypothetical protein